MSYLNDTMLAELCEKHQLVQPYDPARVNPASIDLALGREFVSLDEYEISYLFNEVWITRRMAPKEKFWADAVQLDPGVALLATTAERVRIPDSEVIFRWVERYLEDGWNKLNEKIAFIPACTGELRLKSSAARNGLDHALAGWIDPGFDGTLTLELHAHRPIELVAGKCYVQLVVATMLAAPARSYQQTGRYVGESAIGAVLAKEEK